MMKRNSSKIIKLMMLMVGICLISAPVFGINPSIKVGKLTVVPMVGISMGFQDNIYYENEEGQEDFFLTATPGILFNYKGSPGNFFNLGYSIDLVSYNENDNNNYQTHKPFAEFGVETSFGVYLKASDKYIKTADLYGTEEQYSIGIKTNRWHNKADVALGYKFADRYALEAQYGHYMQRFDLVSDQWQDRTDQIYGMMLSVRVAPKTEIFGQYRITEATYDKQNDSVYLREPDTSTVPPTTDNIDGFRAWNSMDYKLKDYFIGVRFIPGGKLEGEIKVGWGEKDYENETDPHGVSYMDESSWVAETQVNYQMRPRTGVTFKASRQYRGSVDPASTASYLDTAFGLSAKQGLGQRMNLNLGIEWRNNDFVRENPGEPSKGFDILTYNAGLDFSIFTWLKADVNYKYETKEASHTVYDEYEYENNEFTFGVKAVF